MSAGLSWLALASLAALGMLLDSLLGEPRRWHPLVGFGMLANRLERLLNRGSSRIRYCAGALGWLLAVLPLTLLSYWLLARLAMRWPAAAFAGHALLLYFAIGLRSLRDHALPIADALAAGDLARARALTARIVSRDTAQAGPADLAKAGVESLLENGNDAVFGALFWFVVAGGPGALLFRLANTLDAMWGYRTERFNAYGFSAARLDDLLNLMPARLTAFSYALLGNTRAALHCWRTQARLWESPNAGPVMAAGAGALHVLLGGSATYHGKPEIRPALGAGNAAQGQDIRRAWRLVALTGVCWLLALIAAGLLELFFA
ncbi:cobalamin biosynthesis protein [Oxalobacteraceae bacterium CAVE-383]|nr:cobalamin biosynthesis protein [Oxalobacteraceae bacterium CAVE-383]